MTFPHREGHPVPADFLRVEDKLWATRRGEEVSPTIVFRIPENTMGMNLREITDLVVTCHGDYFGVEAVHAATGISPNKLVMSADSLNRTLQAWKQASSRR